MTVAEVKSPVKKHREKIGREAAAFCVAHPDMTLTEIAAKFGISRPTLERMRKDHGVAPRKNGRIKGVSPKTSEGKV